MTIERYRHRRTTGSGPPPDLLFGEMAYSDGDGLIHLGRPDGSVRSYAPGGNVDPDPPTWDAITNKPLTFPSADHIHSYSPLPELGDWTPTYEFSGSGSVAMASFSAGRWRKTGNWVEFQLRIGTASLSAPSGEIRITLPPFPADLNPATWGWPCAIGPCALWGTDMRLSALITLAGHIRLYPNATNASYSILQATAMNPAANGNQIFMVGAYRSTN